MVNLPYSAFRVFRVFRGENESKFRVPSFEFPATPRLRRAGPVADSDGPIRVHSRDSRATSPISAFRVFRVFRGQIIPGSGFRVSRSELQILMVQFAIIRPIRGQPPLFGVRGFRRLAVPAGLSRHLVPP